MPRCLVVIPTYNEAENLPLLVPQVLAQAEQIEVLVVDDDSPDGTAGIAEDLRRRDPRVHLLHRRGRRGLGASYREGLIEALKLGAEVVVQMDADFSHPPDMLPAMLREIESHDAVLGSRYLHGITVVNWPIERILLSYYGNWYVRQVTGLPIRDATGGFRCMRREIVERAGVEHIRSEGYSFQIEMNYRLVRCGARILEIPFLFADRIRGSSKLSLRSGWETLWMAWWLRLADGLGRL